MVEPCERRWLKGFALAVIVFTTIPYLIGYARQGSDWVFSGFVFGVEDGNSYIAKMLLGTSGDWLFRTPYTPYPIQGSLVFLPYILLGKLAGGAGLHEQLVALFHLFRFVGVFLYTWATYDFLALFIREVRWRRLGTALATLGGGFGWLAFLGLGKFWNNQLPLELYSPESFGYLMVFGLPHLACARAFLLWGLRGYLRWQVVSPGGRKYIKTALLWFALALMQPITAVAGWAVIGAHIGLTAIWLAWKRRPLSAAGWAEWGSYFRAALLTGLLSAPLVLCTLLSFQLDPFLKTWQAQNRLASPVFWHYLLAYGLIFPLAIPGIRTVIKSQPWSGWLVAGWVAIFPLMAYAPVTIQRRLPEGVWVALVVLAMTWLESSGQKIKTWAPRWLVLSYAAAFFLLLGAGLSAWRPDRPLFHPAQEVKAYQFLSEPGQKNQIVLASFETSNALPAWAPVRVVTGHGPESINGEALKHQVGQVYATGSPDSLRVDLFDAFNVRYVFWGPEERALGGWDPGQADYLMLVFESGPYRVFEVQGAQHP